MLLLPPRTKADDSDDNDNCFFGHEFNVFRDADDDLGDEENDDTLSDVDGVVAMFVVVIVGERKDSTETTSSKSKQSQLLVDTSNTSNRRISSVEYFRR